MSKYSLKKSQQLGMNFSTACSALRKSIMFKLMQETERDCCYRCGVRIETADDMSIDHKDHWQDNSDPAKAFFDLNNIAFSHLKCNYGHKRGSTVVNSKEGAKGVSTNTGPRRKKPYRATIYNSLTGKSEDLGYYKTVAEAAAAYDQKAEELYGERAVTNKKLGVI